MWTEISTLLLVGLYCIGLCISIFSSFLQYAVSFHILAHSSVQTSVLLFNAIADLIDSARPAERKAAAEWCDASWRTVTAIDRSCGVWITLWCLAGLISLRISQCFVCLFKWGLGRTLSFLFFWLVHWLIPYITDTVLYNFFAYFFFLHYCRDIFSLIRVCTYFFPFSFDMRY